jgi:hypothetical protein
VSEADEIAAGINAKMDQPPRWHSRERLREIVRQQMPEGESEQVIDNVTDALLRIPNPVFGRNT